DPFDILPSQFKEPVTNEMHNELHGFMTNHKGQAHEFEMMLFNYMVNTLIPGRNLEGMASYGLSVCLQEEEDASAKTFQGFPESLKNKHVVSAFEIVVNYFERTTS
ncbi:hypothetical protein CAPTEDRAFT_188581, partial [Capitella teleta]